MACTRLIEAAMEHCPIQDSKASPAPTHYFVDNIGPLLNLLFSPSRSCLLVPMLRLFLPLPFIIVLLLFAARFAGFLLLLLPRFILLLLQVRLVGSKHILTFGWNVKKLTGYVL